MNKLDALRCVELTSQRQADNGTICYHDPITNVDYLSYESGYIRRSYRTRSYWSHKMVDVIYQLNPKRLVTETSKYTGQEYTTYQRIMIDNHEDRMNALARAVVNYRGYYKKNYA